MCKCKYCGKEIENTPFCSELCESEYIKGLNSQIDFVYPDGFDIFLKEIFEDLGASNSIGLE